MTEKKQIIVSDSKQDIDNEKKSGNIKKEKTEFKEKDVTLRVFRINGQIDSPKYDEYTVSTKRWTTVLDALLDIKNFKDSSIAIRYSCRMASCGSCGMKINGIPRLACYTKISELSGDTITCEPLPNFPYIRDLVTDFTTFFENHKNMLPYVQNPKADIKPEEKISEFVQSPSDLDKFLQFSYCIKCGLCYSACPTVATDTKFPGPQALAQAYRYTADSRDTDMKNRFNIIDDRHGIWRCHFAGSCSSVCPKGVDPALGIQLLRNHLLGFSKHEKTVAKLKEHSD